MATEQKPVVSSYLTTEEFAAQIGLTSSSVRKMVSRGVIPARYVVSDGAMFRPMLIHRDAIEIIKEGAPFTGAEIKTHRKRLGLTLRQLAERLGVSEGAVCLWETGKRVPKRSTGLLLRSFFGEVREAKAHA